MKKPDSINPQSEESDLRPTDRSDLRSPGQEGYDPILDLHRQRNLIKINLNSDLK